MFKPLSLLSLCIAISACDQSAMEETATGAPDVQNAQEAAAQTETAPSLDAILAALPEKAQARIPYRHPKETIEFFGIAPGMTVVDTMPGDIWYTGIMADYLGRDSQIIGADRPVAVWEYFGPDYSTPDVMAERKVWPKTWPEKQAEKHAGKDIAFNAITFGNVPQEMAGSVDVVMMIREFHNLLGADKTGALAATVLGEIDMMLKPGGVFAVVQHRASETASDSWANGENGYLKQSNVIALVEAAGFTLEASSEVNANPKDQPTEKDFVWRLPPSLDLPDGSAELIDAMKAIGESDRMTLKFRKNA